MQFINSTHIYWVFTLCVYWKTCFKLEKKFKIRMQCFKIRLGVIFLTRWYFIRLVFWSFHQQPLIAYFYSYLIWIMYTKLKLITWLSYLFWTSVQMFKSFSRCNWNVKIWGTEKNKCRTVSLSKFQRIFNMLFQLPFKIGKPIRHIVQCSHLKSSPIPPGLRTWAFTSILNFLKTQWLI